MAKKKTAKTAKKKVAKKKAITKKVTKKHSACAAGGVFGVDSYWADPKGGPPIPFERRNSLGDWPAPWDEDQDEDPVMSPEEIRWRRKQMPFPGER